MRKTGLAIAIDLGTSGFRAQAIDLSSRKIISTAITTRHPLPGANVIDHIHFALEMGVERAGSIIIRAVSKVMGKLRIKTESVQRMAICGNPIQLSLFQGIEIRDLAYAGKRKLESLGVAPVKREGAVISARNIPGLNLSPECDVIIPPAVCHEIGADALAMIIKTGMLEKDETSIVTDYGTNAEMALFYNGNIFTGSTAAGPALEGQQIECGMLAVPGVISDLEVLKRSFSTPEFRLIVLNSEMLPVKGPVADIRSGVLFDNGDAFPLGITGTGTVALMNQATDAGLITGARINTPDSRLHLTEDIYFTEKDLREAGKAIGSLRAGYITLCHEAGITLEDIHTAYMSGASGTYVDAKKAWRLGMTPPCVKKIFQTGNTSLAMARDLASKPENLEKMQQIAESLRKTHVMFASSEIFKKIYILELSHWTEGMPMTLYRKFLKKYGLFNLPEPEDAPEIIRTVTRDINDTGELGLSTLQDIGEKARVSIEGCTSCENCVKECPERAISLAEDSDPVTCDLRPAPCPLFILDISVCNGVSCRRCERVCPEKVFELKHFMC